MHTSNDPHQKKTPLPVLQRLGWSQARKMLKPHVGYEAFVRGLITIAEDFAAELGTGGFDVERLRTAPAVIDALEKERCIAAAHLAEVEGTLFAQKSALWTEMLAIYARAKSVGRTNSVMRGAIEPFMFFMRTGKRTKPAAPRDSR